jgi:hypothetical protein
VHQLNGDLGEEPITSAIVGMGREGQCIRLEHSPRQLIFLNNQGVVICCYFFPVGKK